MVQKYDVLMGLVVMAGVCISLPFDVLLVLVVLEGGVYPCLMMCW